MKGHFTHHHQLYLSPQQETHLDELLVDHLPKLIACQQLPMFTTMKIGS